MKKPTERIIHRKDLTTTRERVLQYFINGDEYPISATEEKLLKRWKNIYTLKYQHKTDGTTLKMHRAWCEMMNFPISEATAYNDLKDAMWFFGELFDWDPKFKLRMYVEYYEQLHELAKEADDFATAKKCLDSAAAFTIKLYELLNKDSGSNTSASTKNFYMQVNVLYDNGKKKGREITLDGLTKQLNQSEILDIQSRQDHKLSHAEIMKELRKSKPIAEDE